VSERDVGYALSFRYQNRCRHYKLGLTPDGQYEVVGMEPKFDSLEDLIEFHQAVPLTACDGDMVVEPLECAHDLNLGITAELRDGVDTVAKPGRPLKPTRRSTRAGNKRDKHGQLRKNRMTASMVSLVVTPEDNEDMPMREEVYLREPQSPPRWLRGRLTRQQAEEELRGQPDGTFVVRMKIHAERRVVFALSFTYFGDFKHHLLERGPDPGPCWLLDNNPMEEYEHLEDVIQGFMRERDPGLASRLLVGLSKEAAKPPVPPSTPARAHARPVVAPPRLPQSHSSTPGSKGGGSVAGSPASAMGGRPPLPLTPQQLAAGEVNPLDWDMAAVMSWLRSLGLAAHMSSFRHAQIDGRTLLGMKKKQLGRLVSLKKDLATIHNAVKKLLDGDLSDLSSGPGRSGSLRSISSSATLMTVSDMAGGGGGYRQDT